MSKLDEILDKGVVINFKENSIPSLRGGTLEHFCKQNLAQTLLSWRDKAVLEARVDQLLLDYDRYNDLDGGTFVEVLDENLQELKAQLTNKPNTGLEDEEES